MITGAPGTTWSLWIRNPKRPSAGPRLRMELGQVSKCRPETTSLFLRPFIWIRQFVGLSGA